MVDWAAGDSLDYYAVKTAPAKERMACDILCNRNILARLPIRTEREEVVINRRVPRKVIERKTLLVTGLVFVAFPIGYEVPWFALKQRIHVIYGPLGMDHVPTKLDHVGLLRLFDTIVFSDAEVQAHKRTYYAGQRVKVVHGPFAGFDADVEVVNPDSDDLRILCDIFGRKVPVRINADQLDMIEPLAVAAA